jgi:tRNA (guanine37-N1)-methyltransferase
MIMKITILTLFPEYFKSVFSTSMLKRAVEKNLVEIDIVNIRDFALNKHQTTDERPFGGGPGMVMKVEPIDLALQSGNFRKNSPNQKIILTSAKGKMFDQEVARKYSGLENLVLICGHYEGVDERVAENLVDEELRIGDFVLTGGESAVAVVIDAVVRLLPGVLGNQDSNIDESHSIPGQLGYSQYTRPENYKGWQVPKVLLSGDHQKISEWREEQKRQS